MTFSQLNNVMKLDQLLRQFPLYPTRATLWPFGIRHRVVWREIFNVLEEYKAPVGLKSMSAKSYRVSTTKDSPPKLEAQ